MPVMNPISLKAPGYFNPWDAYIRLGYVLLQQTDLAITAYGLSRGFTELNPFMRSLLASPVQLIAVKVVFPLIIAWLVPGKYLLPGLLLFVLVNLLNVLQLFGL